MTDIMRPAAEIDPEEFSRAKRWRVENDLTMGDLAALTGYSISTISWMERGEEAPRHSGPPRKITPRAWFRYKLLCAAVDIQLKSRKHFTFDWEVG